MKCEIKRHHKSDRNPEGVVDVTKTVAEAKVKLAEYRKDCEAHGFIVKKDGDKRIDIFMKTAHNSRKEYLMSYYIEAAQ